MESPPMGQPKHCRPLYFVGALDGVMAFTSTRTLEPAPQGTQELIRDQESMKLP